MKNINTFLLLIMFPCLCFSQNYSVEASSNVICEGELLRVTAQGCDGKVLWQNGRTGKSILDTLYTSQNYSFTCRNSVSNALLGSSLATNIKVVVKPRTPYLFCDEDEIKAGRQAKIEVFGCENDVIWSNGATDKELIVRPQETTTYTVKCVNEQGCESEPISRTIIVKSEYATDGPIVTLKTACLGESLMLKAAGCTQGEYIWYKNEVLDKNQGFKTEELGRGFEIKIDEGGDHIFYTARCLFSECLGNESNRMFVFFDTKLPSIDLPRKVYLDEGESVDLNSLLPNPSISSNSFEFRNGKNSNSMLVNDVSKLSRSMGIYVTEVSQGGKCKSPPAKISIIQSGFGTLLTDREELKTEQKELKPETLNISEPSNTFLTHQSTANGAVISSEKENDDLIEINIAQGFSPNGDGINDVFVIENNLNREIMLRIYNRFGHLVYQKENYNNEWDGAANSGMATKSKIGLPDDTYYYVVQLKNGKQKIGFLTLKR